MTVIRWFRRVIFKDHLVTKNIIHNTLQAPLMLTLNTLNAGETQGKVMPGIGKRRQIAPALLS